MEYTIGMRKTCELEECTRLGRYKGQYKGKRYYGTVCDKHHRDKYNTRMPFIPKQRIENSQCTRCGWDEAYCDRHRIKPEKGYTKDNVMVLCPNCHRLETIKQTQ